jgi:hypothetical protein
VGDALDRIAGRLSRRDRFLRAVAEIEEHYEPLEADFLSFFPELVSLIEIFGEEMIEKRVKASANSSRVYLPPVWVGHNVKIIRID